MYVTAVTRIHGVVSRRSSPNRWVWSLPVMWQRWRSTHSIRNFRKPHAICKLHHSMFYRSRVIADWSFTLRNREFCVFLAKNSGNYFKKFSSQPKNDVAVAEAHFLTYSSSLYATGVRRIQSVVLRRIGGRGHFRSHDKNGGHAIRSPFADNPMLYANFTTIFYRTGVIVDCSFTLQDMEFRAFFAKNSGNY